MRGKIAKAWVWKDPVVMPDWIMILVEFEDRTLFGLTFEGERAESLRVQRARDHGVVALPCSWERVL